MSSSQCEIPTLSIWELSIVWVINGLMCFMLSWAIYSISKTSRFSWLVKMLSMLIVSDLMIIVANTTYVLEMKCDFLFKHLRTIEVFSAIGTAGFNSLLNLFHWLFAFELWQVSI